MIKSQDENGNARHVYAYGTRISDEKVKKETSRYKSCNAHRECCARTELPVGVEIRLNQEAEEEILSPGVQETYFEDLTNEFLSGYQRSSEICWSLASNSGPAQPNDINVCHNRSLSIHSNLPVFGNTLNHDFATAEWFSITSNPPPPSSDYYDIARAMLSHPSRLETNSIPRNTISLFENLNRPLFREFKALLRSNRGNILASIHNTKHLLPSEPSQEVQKASVDIVILKQILYLLMNNFAGSDYAAFDTIFEQVRQFSTAQMEDILDALPHPYAAALQQSILTIAIKSNIPSLVEILVKRGLDINLVQCRFGGESYTPLGLACKFRCLEIVKVLLNRHADPNWCLPGNRLLGPIGLLLESKHKDNEVKTKFPPTVSGIFQCLLDSGAYMSVSELSLAQFWENGLLVDFYINHSNPPRLDTGAAIPGMGIVLEKAALLSQPEKTIAMIRKMLGDVPVSEHSERVKESLSVALETASYQGNLSLVNYLLDAGLSPNSNSLCMAIQGNHLDLVKLYIRLDVGIHKYYHMNSSGIRFPRSPHTVEDPEISAYYALRIYRTTPFAEAIRWGRQEMIALFEEQTIMHAFPSSEKFMAAVYAAAETGNKEIMQKLVEMCMSRYPVSAATSYNLIEIAVMGGYDEIVEFLMLYGVRPNCSSVAAALLTHNARLVQRFLDTGVCINEVKGLVYLAVHWGSKSMLELLIKAGAKVDSYWFRPSALGLSSVARPKNSPLQEAIRRGDRHIFQLLLDNGANVCTRPPVTQASLLTEAINCGNEEFAYELLTRGADPNDPIALQAAIHKSFKIVEAIMTSFRHRYPNGDQTFVVPALRQAIKDNNVTIVNMLAGQAALNNATFTVNEEACFPKFFLSLLGEGIVTGNVEIVSILLRSGGDPDSTVAVATERPRKGRLNPILIAISTGNLAMVQLLHRAGADLRFSATLGITHTSLQLAIEMGHIEIVQYLLDEGVDVNAPPCIWEGATALQVAAKTGSVRIAEMLLDRGASVNAPGSKYVGKTAFEFAAEHGRIDMLLWLFHRDVDITSDGGKQIRRACEFAEKNGQVAAKDLVMQLSACVNGEDFVTVPSDFF